MNLKNKTKVPCRAGQPHAWRLAPRKRGTTLVDCPDCARKNLSSTSAANLGFCDWTGCYEGRAYGLVPPHTEVPLSGAQIPDANFGDNPDDYEVAFKQWCDSPHWEREGSDFDQGNVVCP